MHSHTLKTSQHELEVRHVIDLASAIGTFTNKGRLPEVIEETDFIGEFSDPMMRLHPSTQPLADVLKGMAEHHNYGEEEILEELAECDEELLGIYIQVASPVLTGSSFSWGRCRLMWVAAPTYEEAFNLACEWAKSMGHDHD